MKDKQRVSCGVPVSLSHDLEQVSLLELSQLSGIAVTQLRAAANSAREGREPVPALLPGPMPVHVDGVRCFTPTELGGRIGLSAQQFNRALLERGLQIKRDGQWCPTEAGKAFGVLLQVHKKQQAGTDVLQLKWKETVLSQLVSTG